MDITTKTALDKDIHYPGVFVTSIARAAASAACHGFSYAGTVGILRKSVRPALTKGCDLFYTYPPRSSETGCEPPPGGFAIFPHPNRSVEVVLRRPTIRLQNSDRSNRCFITPFEAERLEKKQLAVRVSARKSHRGTLVYRLLPHIEPLRDMHEASNTGITAAEIKINAGLLGSRTHQFEIKEKIKEYAVNHPRWA